MTDLASRWLARALLGITILMCSLTPAYASNPDVATGSLFRCRGADGTVTYSNIPPSASARCDKMFDYKYAAAGRPGLESYRVLTDGSELTVFYSTERMSLGEKVRTLWLTVSYGEPQRFGDGQMYTRAVARYTFDCGNYSFSSGEGTYYIVRGQRMIYVGAMQSQPQTEPAPDTLGDQLVRGVCHLDPTTASGPLDRH